MVQVWALTTADLSSSSIDCFCLCVLLQVLFVLGFGFLLHKAEEVFRVLGLWG